MNVDGLKMGYIFGVGFNFIVLVVDGQCCFIVVVMGVDSVKGCEEEVKKLLCWG